MKIEVLDLKPGNVIEVYIDPTRVLHDQAFFTENQVEGRHNQFMRIIVTCMNKKAACDDGFILHTLEFGGAYVDDDDSFELITGV